MGAARQLSWSPFPGSLWRRSLPIAVALAAVLLACGSARAAAQTVSVYLTSENLSHRLTPEPSIQTGLLPPRPGSHTIQVDDSSPGQTYHGVGGAMTDSSAWLLENLRPAARQAWMNALFNPRGAGLDFVRVPIGASDFTAIGQPYTYDDLPAKRVDRQLRFFSIFHDYWNILPALKQALRIYPGLRVMASLWSAPAWMKVNDALNDENGAGKLRGDMYKPLAQYFIKFLEAYRAAGVPVSAVTPQNEPGEKTMYPGGNLSEPAEADLVAAYLGPALRAAHLPTQLYGFDYDWTASEPPFVAALRTSAARPYLGGIAWHCYYGNAVVMSQLHKQDPGLDQVVSECSQGHRYFSTSELLIAAFRNWATAVNLWNLALEPDGGPVEMPNWGCRGCAGILTINPRTGKVTATIDFYELAQLSHFVQPGAVRLQSTTLVKPVYLRLVTPGVDDVVFQNPDGQKVLMAYNSATTAQAFTVQDGGQYFSYTLAPATTVTFVW